jgi:hypothetical protein
MATLVPSGTQFIGLSATYQTVERRSALINNESAPYTIEDIASDTTGQSIYANGFTIAGAINTDIALPENATVNYTGPLSMGTGYILTVPTGTTLNIL